MTIDQHDLDQINDRLSRMEAKIDTLATAQTAQCEACQWHRQRVTSLEHVVYGNGKDGLRLEVDRLKVESTLRSKAAWALIGGVSAVVASVVTAIGGVVLHVIGG